jgi:NDP-sugar pyrophosphorylase family protein
MANSPFGVFAIGGRVERSLNRLDVLAKAALHALLERTQILSSSYMVQVGKNVHIDPTATIQGPTIIGDNVDIGADCLIGNCIIGSNVNIMHGSQLLLSVVGDGCFLPFRASLFMTTLMENSMVAQNATLQYCVIGRDTFIGANVTFTDFNLLSQPLRTMHRGRLERVDLPILGCCIGHNCRLGAALVFYPGRTVESDTVLVRSTERAVISKNVSYEASDHHAIRGGEIHPRLYPRD